MQGITLSSREFHKHTLALCGIPVASAEPGFGSAIFLQLATDRIGACISVHWDWRVESSTAIEYGSSNSRTDIAAGIATLQGVTVRSITVAGDIPELSVHFANGHILRTMCMVTGDPHWSIRIDDKQWIQVRRGALVLGHGTAPETTVQELAAFAHAETTATRWGVASPAAKHQACANCASFIALDGDGHFLDYGACTSAASAFDRHIVAKRNGCPAFAAAKVTA
jgi:hypothetical protein